MLCPECQFENRRGAKFCNECGHKLEITCFKCNNVNRPESKFCDECGYDLSKALLPRESVRSPQEFDTHSSTSIPTNNSKGERRQATVVFSDLSGYAGLSERIDPEEVERIMGRIKEEAVGIVESYGGIVNQFVGDEIIALFGIPTAHEDDPLRAVKAAMRLHKMVRKTSSEVENLIGIPLTLHTGINTGLVVTSLRDERDGLYGITGETVNIGARLQSLAESDKILVSPVTKKLITPYFETIALEETVLKGKTEPTIPYQVIGESKIQTRFEFAEQKGFTTYTGRDQELDILHTCLDKVFRGEGQFITVVGEAGMGKSRLHYELRHRLDREKITVLQGWCQSYGRDIPYFPFINALQRGLKLSGDHSSTELSEKAVNNIMEIDSSLEQFVPFYLHLLSIPSKYHLPAHLKGKELRKTMEDALAAIISLNTKSKPMVMILEDWHWSDDASQSALEKIIDVTASIPLMLMVTYRPIYQANWRHSNYHTPVILKPLEVSNTKNIIKSAIGASHLPERLGKLIHEHTSGNPLFIEEICYSIIEDGVAEVKGGKAYLTKSISQISLPDTVQAIIRTRLDRLNKADKEVIRVASVIGRVFSQRILEQVCSSKINLSESLETLISGEVIQQTRVVPEAEFTFRHVMAQAVVYETLLLKQRKEIHGAIGRTIEELYSDRLDEQLPILAYHYIRSDEQNKAIDYALLAGDQAAGLYANKEATVYYEQALKISQTASESIESKKNKIDATLKLASVGLTRQDIERDLKNLESVRDLAEALNDEPNLARILYWLGRIHYVLWNPQTAMKYAKESLVIADSLGDEALSASPVNLMGRVYYQLSEFEKAGQFLERSVLQMREIGDKVEESTASALSGYMLAFIGEFDRAFLHANHSVQLAQKIQNPFAKANAYHLKGCVFDQQGQWNKAIKDYQEAIHTAQKVEDLFRLYLVKSWKGRAHTMIGEVSNGRELLEESLTLAEKIGTKFWMAWQKTALAACLFKLEELARGAQLCQEAIKLGEETNDKFVIAFANRTYAEILYHLNPADPEIADRAILDAIRILQEINAQPELGRSYASYALLLSKSGKEEKAQNYITQAISLFQKMGMSWDFAQADQIQRGLV